MPRNFSSLPFPFSHSQWLKWRDFHFSSLPYCCEWKKKKLLLCFRIVSPVVSYLLLLVLYFFIRLFSYSFIDFQFSVIFFFFFFLSGIYSQFFRVNENRFRLSEFLQERGEGKRMKRVKWKLVGKEKWSVWIIFKFKISKIYP